MPLRGEVLPVIIWEVVGLQAIEALILTFLTVFGWAVIERLGSYTPKPTERCLLMLVRFFCDSTSKSFETELKHLWLA